MWSFFGIDTPAATTEAAATGDTKEVNEMQQQGHTVAESAIDTPAVAADDASGTSFWGLWSAPATTPAPPEGKPEETAVDAAPATSGFWSWMGYPEKSAEEQHLEEEQQKQQQQREQEKSSLVALEEKGRTSGTEKKKKKKSSAAGDDATAGDGEKKEKKKKKKTAAVAESTGEASVGAGTAAPPRISSSEVAAVKARLQQLEQQQAARLQQQQQQHEKEEEERRRQKQEEREKLKKAALAELTRQLQQTREEAAELEKKRQASAEDRLRRRMKRQHRKESATSSTRGTSLSTGTASGDESSRSGSVGSEATTSTAEAETADRRARNRKRREEWKREKAKRKADREAKRKEERRQFELMLETAERELEETARGLQLAVERHQQEMQQLQIQREEQLLRERQLQQLTDAATLLTARIPSLVTLPDALASPEGAAEGGPTSAPTPDRMLTPPADSAVRFAEESLAAQQRMSEGDSTPHTPEQLRQQQQREGKEQQLQASLKKTIAAAAVGEALEKTAPAPSTMKAPEVTKERAPIAKALAAEPATSKKKVVVRVAEKERRRASAVETDLTKKTLAAAESTTSDASDGATPAKKRPTYVTSKEILFPALREQQPRPGDLKADFAAEIFSTSDITAAAATDGEQPQLLLLTGVPFQAYQAAGQLQEQVNRLQRKISAETKQKEALHSRYEQRYQEVIEQQKQRARDAIKKFMRQDYAGIHLARELGKAQSRMLRLFFDQMRRLCAASAAIGMPPKQLQQQKREQLIKTSGSPFSKRSCISGGVAILSAVVARYMNPAFSMLLRYAIHEDHTFSPAFDKRLTAAATAAQERKKLELLIQHNATEASRLAAEAARIEICKQRLQLLQQQASFRRRKHRQRSKAEASPESDSKMSRKQQLPASSSDSSSSNSSGSRDSRRRSQQLNSRRLTEAREKRAAALVHTAAIVDAELVRLGLLDDALSQTSTVLLQQPSWQQPQQPQRILTDRRHHTHRQLKGAVARGRRLRIRNSSEASSPSTRGFHGNRLLSYSSSSSSSSGASRSLSSDIENWTYYAAVDRDKEKQKQVALALQELSKSMQKFEQQELAQLASTAETFTVAAAQAPYPPFPLERNRLLRAAAHPAAPKAEKPMSEHAAVMQQPRLPQSQTKLQLQQEQGQQQQQLQRQQSEQDTRVTQGAKKSTTPVEKHSLLPPRKQHQVEKYSETVVVRATRETTAPTQHLAAAKTPVAAKQTPSTAHLTTAELLKKQPHHQLLDARSGSNASSEKVKEAAFTRSLISSSKIGKVATKAPAEPTKGKQLLQAAVQKKPTKRHEASSSLVVFVDEAAKENSMSAAESAIFAKLRAVPVRRKSTILVGTGPPGEMPERLLDA